jgi:hypothetical protein
MRCFDIGAVRHRGGLERVSGQNTGFHPLSKGKTLAAERGRSMNAEVVTALAAYIAHWGEPDDRTIKDALAKLTGEIEGLKKEAKASLELLVQEAISQMKNPPE